MCTSQSYRLPGSEKTADIRSREDAIAISESLLDGFSVFFWPNMLIRLWLWSSVLHACLAQFPAEPSGITTIRSRFNDKVTISYKETHICETTPGVRSFSGYVHLPPGILDDLDGQNNTFPMNTFFWFFEARKDPANAPLSLWMNGGPGASSMLGLLVENGPCYVNSDSNSTRLSEWSWNNEVNMLYLDQPVQTGFSYDSLANGIKDLVEDEATLLNATNIIPTQNATLMAGTYPSMNSNHTLLGSINAAHAVWHFAQAWFQEFPEHRPNNSKISIATESYGGRYGPAFASFFQEQNERILSDTWTVEGEQYLLDLDTLFIINGCIDRLVMYPSFPHIAYNNTYGIEAVNKTVYDSMIDALYREGGCNDQIYHCQNLSSEYDPENLGINASVNSACQNAEEFCAKRVRGLYQDYSGRNYYDFGTLDPDPETSPFFAGYLNQPHVQAALGVPLNWTRNHRVASNTFRRIGDYVRPGWLEDLAYLLERGIKVHLAYGDRDYACNWIGGEAVSLAINWTNSTAFANAGYTALMTNNTHEGGQVRQYRNLSFTRVYQAGHEVPWYQPETAYKIFMRALNNLDIATGTQNVTAQDGTLYGSVGTADTWHIKNEDPPEPLQFCYVLDLDDRCTDDQINAILNHTAEIQHYIVCDTNSTRLFPELMANCSMSGVAYGGNSNATGGYALPGYGDNLTINPGPPQFGNTSTSNTTGPSGGGPGTYTGGTNGGSKVFINASLALASRTVLAVIIIALL
ncbi:Carboxypeptidase S1-like B [Pseudocercospora fuligena]|uniref:Carboxypeptidase n=1 Tax=Pseudocercospora fuligena TaxID=685502 RepID=A0A8H6RNE3_9PEZI|nr:Carboxypeptidase S1-like B [Pseudocercospora fuligena]